VYTKIDKEGKHAIIKLAEGYSAEDVGMRIGVF
jgi:large subunit ribosomal protein L23